MRPSLLGDWGGLRSTLEDNGVVFSLTQISDVLGNFNGGVKQGVEYDGLFQPQVDLDLDRLMGWRGGNAHVGAYVIQGQGLSQTNIQNFMTVTNTEFAPAGAKMGEIWVQQTMFDEILKLKIGQIQADINFDTLDSAQFMINSTWGWPAIWAQNMPGGGPNYPDAVPGAQLILTPNAQWMLQGAVFNGNPTGKTPSSNMDGLAFPLGQGILSMAEVAYKRNPNGHGGMPGTYKVGGWYNSQTFDSLSMAANGVPLASDESTGTPQTYKGNYSLYASIDQAIWRDANTDNQGPNVFASVHISPQTDRNQVSWFVEGGLAYTGLIDGRPLDQCALGVAYMNMSSSYANNVRYENQYQNTNQPIPNFEAIVEMTYQAVISPWLAVQPFLTYVINPGARAPLPQNNQLAIPNATVLGLRTIVSF